MRGFITRFIQFCGIGCLILLPVCSLKYWDQSRHFLEINALQGALANGVNVVMFGDSVNRDYAATDHDRRAISEMLDDMLPGSAVHAVDHPAYHAELFREFVRYILQTPGGKVRLFVVPINLRSFSPEWHLRPDYQFVRERYLLNRLPFIADFLFQGVSARSFLNTPILYGNTQIGTVGEFERSTVDLMRTGFIYHYMQPLEARHPKLLALEEIEKLARRARIPVIFYITPVDWVLAECVGVDGFARQVSSSCELVQNALSSCTVIDLSLSLGSCFFHHTARPYEHLNEIGRLFVAQTLLRAIEDDEISKIDRQKLRH